MSSQTDDKNAAVNRQRGVIPESNGRSLIPATPHSKNAIDESVAIVLTDASQSSHAIVRDLKDAVDGGAGEFSFDEEICFETATGEKLTHRRSMNFAKD